MPNAQALKAGIEAALPAEKRDSVQVVIHGSPALMTAYFEAWVEGGPTLWTRKTGAKDPEGMYFAASGYMKRPGLYEVPSDADIAKMVKKI